MKRFGLSVVFLNILVFCMAATVWEGTAAVSVEGELPEEGLYIATGSLPQNTVVDVTNLVNGNTVRVTIMSDLELPGLLALLSPETAERIGLSRVSLARIRMTLSEIEEAVYSSGGAASGAGASGGEDDYVIMEDDEDAADYYEDAGYVYDDYTDEDFAPENSVPVAPGPEPPPPPPPAAKSPPQQAPNQSAYEYSLIPAEERPPSAPPPPAPAAPPAPTPAPPAAPPAQTPRVSAPPTPPPRASAPPAQPSGYADPRFSVPVITNLERGKYYLQLGSYIAAEVVESELTRIGRMYPLTIQRAEKDGYPFYRILIGPISRGESAALLQRFRDNGYRDAFIRHGN